MVNVHVYLLAGQSNIASWGPLSGAAVSPSDPRVNPDVLYYDSTRWQQVSNPANVEFGHGIREAIPPGDVAALWNIGIDGSALVRNDNGVNRTGWWLPDRAGAIPGDALTVFANAWAQEGGVRSRLEAALGHPSYTYVFHVVWCQGETDALYDPPDHFSRMIDLFAAFRTAFGVNSTMNVYLINLGRIDVGAQSESGAQVVRAAFLELDLLGSADPRFSFRLVAEHYDLPLIDSYHHSPSDYVVLAARAALGVLAAPSFTLQRVTTSRAANRDLLSVTLTMSQAIDPQSDVSAVQILDDAGQVVRTRPTLFLGSNTVTLDYSHSPIANSTFGSAAYIRGSGRTENWSGVHNTASPGVPLRPFCGVSLP